MPRPPRTDLVVASTRGFRLSPERRGRLSAHSECCSEPRVSIKSRLSGYYPVFPSRPLGPQGFGELLADLGHLGVDDDLAVHAGRVVRIELAMLWLCLVERLELGDLRDHGTEQVASGVQLFDVVRRLVSLSVAGVEHHRAIPEAVVGALAI